MKKEAMNLQENREDYVGGLGWIKHEGERM